MVYDADATPSPTVSVWMEGAAPASVATLLQEVGPGLLFQGPNQGGTYSFDEVRVYPGRRSQDWLEVDADSIAGRFTEPCLSATPGSNDQDADGICDDLDVCPSDANEELDGTDCPESVEHSAEPTPTDGVGPTDGAPSDTGPALRLPAGTFDPGCACDSSPSPSGASLGALLALALLRRRRQA